MYCGMRLSREVRWAATKLVSHYQKLVESALAEERTSALRYLADLGDVGLAALRRASKRPSAAVRSEVQAQLARAAAREQERQSWLTERRPFFLPSVSKLLSAVERHRDSQRHDDRRKVREAVIRLGFHGPRASSAASEVRKLADATDPWIRVCAIRALWNITRNADVVVPLLHASLRPEPVAFLVLDCARQIGLAARPLAADLNRIVTSELRYFQHDPCDIDEAFQRACVDTLRVIDAGT
jgi:hypothetical protein